MAVQEVSNEKSALESALLKGAADKDAPHKRTPGIWAFDTLLYPFFANIAVWAFSVWVTYKTNYSLNKENWLFKRGEQSRTLMREGLEWFGMENGKAAKTAENFIMVMWSFIDGSLIALFVKPFEDRRKSISQWLDDKFGTKPKDESVYDQEPKHSWGSVLWGRVVTFAFVISAFFLLQKEVKGKSMNDWVFKTPAEALVKKFPGLAAKFGKEERAIGITKTVLFEAFYTSLCTAGLYLWSRVFARHANKKEAQHKAEIQATSTAPKAVENNPSEAITDGQHTQWAKKNPPEKPSVIEPSESHALSVKESKKATLEAAYV